MTGTLRHAARRRPLLPTHARLWHRLRRCDIGASHLDCRSVRPDCRYPGRPKLPTFGKCARSGVRVDAACAIGIRYRYHPRTIREEEGSVDRVHRERTAAEPERSRLSGKHGTRFLSISTNPLYRCHSPYDAHAPAGLRGPPMPGAIGLTTSALDEFRDHYQPREPKKIDHPHESKEIESKDGLAFLRQAPASGVKFGNPRNPKILSAILTYG